MQKLLLVVAGVAIALLSGQTAHAAPLQPDYGQPANGSGQTPGNTLTPALSPVQLPPPRVDGHTVVAYPYLSPWVHDLVPVPAGTTVELRGAARVTAGDAVINPNGHCLFGDPSTVSGNAATAPIRLDTNNFQLAIDATLQH